MPVDVAAYERDLSSITQFGPWEITSKEQALNKQVFHSDDMKNVFPIDDIHKISDCDLIYRFLIAKRWNVEETCSQMKEYVKFRKQYDLNNILWETDIPQEIVSITPFFLGRDLFGYPLGYNEVNPKAFSAIKGKFDKELIMKGHLWMMEMGRRVMKASGKDRISFIVNMAQLSASIVTDSFGRNMFKEMSHVDQTFYPELVRTIIIVNPGWLFGGLWKFVRPLLDPRVQAKVQVMSKKDGMSKWLDLSQVLAEYGGTAPSAASIAPLPGMDLKGVNRGTPPPTPGSELEKAQSAHLTRRQSSAAMFQQKRQMEKQQQSNNSTSSAAAVESANRPRNMVSPPTMPLIKPALSDTCIGGLILDDYEGYSYDPVARGYKDEDMMSCCDFDEHDDHDLDLPNQDGAQSESEDDGHDESGGGSRWEVHNPSDQSTRNLSIGSRSVEKATMGSASPGRMTTEMHGSSPARTSNAASPSHFDTTRFFIPHATLEAPSTVPPAGSSLTNRDRLTLYLHCSFSKDSTKPLVTGFVDRHALFQTDGAVVVAVEDPQNPRIIAEMPLEAGHFVHRHYLIIDEQTRVRYILKRRNIRSQVEVYVPLNAGSVAVETKPDKFLGPKKRMHVYTARRINKLKNSNNAPSANAGEDLRDWALEVEGGSFAKHRKVLGNADDAEAKELILGKEGKHIVIGRHFLKQRVPPGVLFALAVGINDLWHYPDSLRK